MREFTRFSVEPSGYDYDVVRGGVNYRGRFHLDENDEVTDLLIDMAHWQDDPNRHIYIRDFPVAPLRAAAQALRSR